MFNFMRRGGGLVEKLVLVENKYSDFGIFGNYFSGRARDENKYIIVCPIKMCYMEPSASGLNYGLQKCDYLKVLHRRDGQTHTDRQTNFSQSDPSKRKLLISKFAGNIALNVISKISIKEKI